MVTREIEMDRLARAMEDLTTWGRGCMIEVEA